MLAVTNCRGEIFGVCVDARSEARTRTSSQPLAGARLSGPRAGSRLAGAIERELARRAACAVRQAGRGSALAPPPRLPPSGTSPRFRAVGPRRAPRRAHHASARTPPSPSNTHTHTPEFRERGPPLPAPIPRMETGRAARAHILTRASLMHDAARSAHSSQLVHKAHQERAIMASQVIPVSFSEVVNVRRALSPLARRGRAHFATVARGAAPGR